MAGGRPSIYSKELSNIICDRLILGESLRSICRDDTMPNLSTVVDWIKSNSEFSAQYATARELQAELIIDEILDIADDSSKDVVNTDLGKIVDQEVIQRSRLRVDTRKWLIGKMYPKKYGEKITQEITGKDGQPIQQAITIKVEFDDDSEVQP